MIEALKKSVRDFLILATIFGLLLLAVFVLDDGNPNYNGVVEASKVPEDENVRLDFISGTEYNLPRDHNGSTIVSLRDNNNNFINTTCWNTILYPDRSVYQPETQMSQDGFYGTYYQHWQIPDDKLGIFQQDVKCFVKNKNISEGKGFHVSNITNVILASTNSLNGTIHAVLGVVNCTESSYLCDYLGALNTTLALSNISVNINVSSLVDVQNLTQITLSINSTINQLGKVYYEISAPDCIIGTFWNFQANVTDEAYHALPFLDCTLITSNFGTQSVPFNKAVNRYTITNNCTTPTQTINWSFDCVRV